MKLYTAKFAPNPRRVEIYLEEKGITIERVMVDMLKGEHRAPEFLAKNPLGVLPVLELDDGSPLTESLAICHYLDELHPEPALFGTTPLERARVREAERIAELGLLFSAATAFQNTAPFFAKRLKQSEDVANEARQRFARVAQRIDGLLDGHDWLAGDFFSMADITAICAVDFGKVSGCTVPEELTRAQAWLGRVRQRPTCAL
jgi:glutathione S-transferase